ncbi:uncharacterized protein F4822DRAFT_38466 [Hypoxylon trugodes]|uniref:uncharacterized protein n=1 Tax=Hypoxylon trugodes TaxID=326681 RepID=UPI002194B034|nr:uncharacterized protein F4822DRAFT_38466 [Hypoxylon trugodes]KAI1394143.1 hypothetical protein F4822DRAFT_38466 [Hypoxylon trugodes]
MSVTNGNSEAGPSDTQKKPTLTHVNGRPTRPENPYAIYYVQGRYSIFGNGIRSALNLNSTTPEPESDSPTTQLTDHTQVTTPTPPEADDERESKPKCNGDSAHVSSEYVYINEDSEDEEEDLVVIPSEEPIQEEPVQELAQGSVREPAQELVQEPIQMPKPVIKRKPAISHFQGESRAETSAAGAAANERAGISNNTPNPFTFEGFQNWYTRDHVPFRPTLEEQRVAQQNFTRRMDEVIQSERRYTPPFATKKGSRFWGLENKLKVCLEIKFLDDERGPNDIQEQEAKCRKFLTQSWQRLKKLFGASETFPQYYFPDDWSNSHIDTPPGDMEQREALLRESTPIATAEVAQPTFTIADIKKIRSKGGRPSRFTEHEAISLMNWTSEDFDADIEPIPLQTLQPIPENEDPFRDDDETPVNEMERSAPKDPEEDTGSPPPFARVQKPPMTGLWFAGKI